MKNAILLLISICLLHPILNAQYIPVPAGNSRSLNGTWKFNPSPDAATFSSTKYHKEWKDISVPGEWTMQGFDVKKGARAAYQTKFDVPANWADKKIILRFDAVYSDAIIWVNGKKACSHTGGFNVFECDITPYLKKGTNLLTAGVMNESIADTLSCGSQYAAHPLGGIPRKVTIFSLPELHISDLFIKTVFDKQYINATLQLDMIFNALNPKPTDGVLDIALVGPDGKQAADKQVKLKFSGGHQEPVSVSIDVHKPLQWNVEYPNLYTLKLTVTSASGAETIIRKVGFRQLEIAGSQLFLNGAPIKLHGVDRHEVHPLTGRSLNIGLWREDVRLYKEANVNYIRTSHYPPAEEFIDLCDSAGLYVELENPLVWIGHNANLSLDFRKAWDVRLRKELIKTTRETITFYRSHPCIIIWSLANESAWTDNWLKTKEVADSIDPTRPKSFHDQAYGQYNNYGSGVMQIANIHYPGPHGPEVADTFQRPLLFGEYCHLNTYNRQEIATDPGVRDTWAEGFHRMWEKMYRSKGCLGGAIWSGIDDAFMLPDGRLVGYGEWGPVDGWRRKKPEYYHVMKTYSPVIINNRRAEVSSSGEILLQVENRFDFTDLADCRFEWELNGIKGTALTTGKPHNSSILRIIPAKGKTTDNLLKVRIYSPFNRLIDEDIIETGSGVPEKIPLAFAPGKPVIKSETTTLLGIRSGETEWTFDKHNAKLVSVICGADTVIAGGAELMVLPLYSQECKTEHSLNIPFINETCSGWNPESVSTSVSGDTIIVSVKGSYAEGDATFRYYFAPEGKLLVRYSFTAGKDIDPRQVGLVFTVPGSEKNLSWSRKGFWSSYPEWHIGRSVGQAVPFPQKAFFTGTPWKKPETEWRFDANALGTNDFRSTKAGIYYASLTGEDGKGIAAVSDGKHAFRSWVSGSSVRFLVADYSNGGAEIFFASHLEAERRPLHKGDRFDGLVELRVINIK